MSGDLELDTGSPDLERVSYIVPCFQKALAAAGVIIRHAQQKPRHDLEIVAGLGASPALENRHVPNLAKFQ